MQSVNSGFVMFRPIPVQVNNAAFHNCSFLSMMFLLSSLPVKADKLKYTEHDQNRPSFKSLINYTASFSIQHFF